MILIRRVVTKKIKYMKYIEHESVTYSPFVGICDRPNDQQTVMRVQRRVTLPKIKTVIMEMSKKI